jgi:polyisoprenyl-teichoic acid--peptidoglycan teichoic acid transferase
MSSLPSPSVAALLSFLFPGAGQLYAGDARRGALWAIPTVILVLGVVYVLATGLDALEVIADSQAVAALLVINLAFFFYHLAATFDAYSLAQRERRLERINMPPSAPFVLAGLVVLALLLHGVPQVLGVVGNDQLERLFPGRATEVIPTPSFAAAARRSPPASVSPSTAGSPTDSPTAAPSDSPTLPPSTTAPTIPPATEPPTSAAWAADGRLDMLLVGGDAGPGRAGLRTDSMILLSVDIATGRAALIGFPRNLTDFPLPPEVARSYQNGRFPQLLNALFRTAQHHPEIFPGEDIEIRGWRAITGAIQEMAGVPIDGVLGVDMNGFSMLVDELGGLWVDVPLPVSDYKYHPEDGSEPITLNFKPGCREFSGSRALAYSRTRHQDSDYRRMKRQQTVLLAMRRQYDPLELLDRIPGLIDLAGDHLFTTFARDEIPDLARIANRVDADSVIGVRFTPTILARLGGIDGIKGKVRNIFDEPEPEPEPEQSVTPSTPSDSCPP